MNDIMTVDHGIAWFWKSSIHGAVNRTGAVACSPKFLAKRLDLMQRKMEGQRRDACMQTHTHTHGRTHTVYCTHITCQESGAAAVRL